MDRGLALHQMWPTPLLGVPVYEPSPEAKRSWGRLSLYDENLGPITTRISELKRHRLAVTMVVGDFLCHRLIPLRDCGCPTWQYTGVNDIGQTKVGPNNDLSLKVLEMMLTWLLSSHGEPALPDGVLPLYDDPNCATICQRLSSFDAQGIMTPRVRFQPVDPCHQQRRCWF